MPEPNHCSYVLRLWREHSGASWRVTLIPTAQPNTRQHFETVQACFAFVETQTTQPNESQPLIVTENTVC